MNHGLPESVAALAQWSTWQPFTAQTVRTAPTTPGVYLFADRHGLTYVGQAGLRSGKGLRGRLTIYVSGRAPHSGLGNLALQHALHDPDWLRQRLADLEAGHPQTVQQWSVAAVERAQLHLAWASTSTSEAAIALERAVLDALHQQPLWNRKR